MYVLQTAACLTYAGFLMEQIRNPHDLMRDLVQEFPVYEYAPRMVDLTYDSFAGGVSDVYRLLAQMGICGSGDIAMSRAFSKEVDALLAR
jgi:hypothetical protein